MNTFTIRVLDSTGQQEFTDVVSFVGEDASGSFGILAGHARMIAALVVGLARFQRADGSWRYLAMPAAVLYFENNVLSLCSRRCLAGDDYEAISTALREQLLAEESRLASMKDNLHRMEDEILRRLWEIARTEA